MITQNVNILLVEDNEDDVIMTLEAFSEANMANQVKVLSDGQELMDYLEKNGQYKNARSPALVLLDINMPRKNGFEALQEIKANPALEHIPVIMLTTSSREEDVVKSYSFGACAYISKPVSFEEFTEMVRHFSLYWSLVSRVPGEQRGR